MEIKILRLIKIILLTFHDYDIELIERVKAIIDADISRHHTIEALALQVAIGKTKLKEGFRVYYGIGVYAYLRQIRMTRAMELITGTHQPIKQIAKACGYRYHNNFMAAFRSYHGITARQARLQAKK